MKSHEQSAATAESRWSLGPMTPDEVHALPAAVEFVDAARAFNLKRSLAHELARQGRFPVPLIRLGHAYRARKADILRALGIDHSGSGDAA